MLNKLYRFILRHSPCLIFGWYIPYAANEYEFWIIAVAFSVIMVIRDVILLDNSGN